MAIDAQLIAARADYDKGVTNDAGFASAVNALLAFASASMTDAEKVAAFDTMVQQIVPSFQIRDLEDGIQGQRSGTFDIIGEAAVMAAFGPDAFEFINKTYEQG